MKVRVRLWGSLQSLAGGKEELEVAAGTLGEAVRAIARQEPGLAGQLDRGVSFAVDGVIYRDALLVELTGEEEIVMLPRMVGG